MFVFFRLFSRIRNINPYIFTKFTSSVFSYSKRCTFASLCPVLLSRKSVLRFLKLTHCDVTKGTYTFPIKTLENLSENALF